MKVQNNTQMDVVKRGLINAFDSLGDVYNELQDLLAYTTDNTELESLMGLIDCSQTLTRRLEENLEQ